MRIVTLTVNPALDKSSSTASILPEKKLRCAPIQVDAGGGGINVSKGLHKLGVENIAVFPEGGKNGAILKQLLEKSGMHVHTLPLLTETRENISITDQHTGLQYRFTMPGLPMSIEDSVALLGLIEELQPDIIVASGSLPDGLADTYYKDVARLAHQINAKMILDCSGTPLLRAAEEGVFLLKPNLGELSALSGVTELAMDEVDDAARNIIAQGQVQVVVVSLGGQGALLVTKDKLEHVPAPPVKVKTTVGAGDSMVAGMVWALSQGNSLSEMVRKGVACGTAATQQTGTLLFEVEQAKTMLNWINKNAAQYRITDF